MFFGKVVFEEIKQSSEDPEGRGKPEGLLDTRSHGSARALLHHAGQLPERDLPMAGERELEGKPHSPGEETRHWAPDGSGTRGDLDSRVSRAQTQS